MVEYLTVTGVVLSHEGQPLGGRRVVATPRPENTALIDGEQVSLFADTISNNLGQFVLEVVKAPATIYNIQTKPERRLVPGIELVADDYPAGSIIPLASLPHPPVPTPTPGMTLRTSIPFYDARTALTIGTGLARMPNATGRTLTLREVRADLAIPTDGSSLVVDLHNNGVTVFTDQAHRPEIGIGSYWAEAPAIDVPLWHPDDVLTCDIDQVGLVVAGGILTVTVVVEG